MRRILLVMVLALAMAGCGWNYRPPAANPKKYVFTVNAPRAKVWPAVVAAFAEINIPIKNIDKSSGLIASDPMRSKMGPDCNCGDRAWRSGTIEPFSDEAMVRFNVFITGDNPTTIQINTRFSYTYIETTQWGIYKLPLTCVSTGRIEGLIRQKILAKMEP